MRFLRNLYNDYICLDVKDFLNLDTSLEINKLLFFVFLGLCVASVIINLNNYYVIVILRKLFRLNSFNEEGAKSLGDLNLDNSRILKYILINKSGSLKKLILNTEAKLISYEEYVKLESELKNAKKLPKNKREERIKEIKSQMNSKTDLSSAKFYINPEMKDYAENFIRTKNVSALKTCAYCVLILIFYILTALIMPSLLSLISNIF